MACVSKMLLGKLLYKNKDGYSLCSASALEVWEVPEVTYTFCTRRTGGIHPLDEPGRICKGGLRIMLLCRNDTWDKCIRSSPCRDHRAPKRPAQLCPFSPLKESWAVRDPAR